MMKPVVQTTMVVAAVHGMPAGDDGPPGVGGVRLLRAADDDRPRPGRSSRRSVSRSRDCDCGPACSAACTGGRLWRPSPCSARPGPSARRVYVSRPVVRNISETRYVCETMTRQVPVQTCTMVAEERVENCPVTTCRWSPRSASSPTKSAPARWSPRSGSRSCPVTTCTDGRRGAGRALRGSHLHDGGRGARRELPRHHLHDGRRGAGRALRGSDLPDRSPRSGSRTAR